MRSAILVLVLLSAAALCAAAQAAGPAGESVQDILDRGDALRHAGDFAGALAAYQAAVARGGETAESWKRIAWARRGLGEYSGARAAFEKALAIDPSDREARDDLRSLQLSRGLSAQGWVGGTEPGTSRTGVDGELWYGGIDHLEISAGGGWTDEIFYASWKGFASAYWYFLPSSYAKLKLGLYGYTYSAPGSPQPDSASYQYDPRAQLEVSHWFTGFLRGSIGYQLDVPNFQYDTSTWFTTHKATGELEGRLGGLHLLGMAGLLYDPDPSRTVVANSPSNTGLLPTSIAYRVDWLLGGGISYDGGTWSLGSRILTNRDLDSSYAWSIISRFTLQPLSWLSFDAQWILDRYSANAGAPYANQYGSILWGEAGFEVLPGVMLAAGAKWVTNPGPASLTSAAARSDVSLLLNLRYRTGLY